MKFAIIKTGGKQFKVAEGDTIEIEKIDADAGDEVKFEEVLLIAGSDKVEIGAPKLGKTVLGKVVNQFKDKKIRIIKFKAKKRYKKAQGHRQLKTQVLITKVGA